MPTIEEVKFFAEKNRGIIEKLMNNPELWEEVTELTDTEKRANGIPQDIKDLIAGLGYMGDLPGCYYPLEKLEILSRVIDEVAEGENLPWDDKEIITMAYWQRKIIDEIRQILDAQDCIIKALKRRFRLSSTKLVPDDKYVEPDCGRLRSLRSLANAFQGDNLFYTETIDVTDLKAWAIAHGFEFETVKDLLGGEVKDRRAA